jgi:hypothetical protein
MLPSYSDAWSTNAFFGVIALVFVLALYFRKPQKRSLPLPPGPKKMPIIGNLLQLPTAFEWEVYAKWSEIYSTFNYCDLYTSDD